MSSQHDDPIISYLIDHLFLPPRINDDWLNTACAIDMESDNRINQAELGLLSFVHTAVCRFRDRGILNTPTAVEGLKRAEKMLRVMRKLQASPPGSPQFESFLMEELTGMEEGDVVTLHVRARNAAVMLRHCGSTVAFSCFGVSLPPSDVLTSPCRLECSYPSTTISISSRTFYLQNFLEQIIKFLSSLSAASLATQFHPDMDIAIYQSYDQSHDGQSRQSLVDTWQIDLQDHRAPTYITEFLTVLTDLLRRAGDDVNLGLGPDDQEAKVSKRIADEVLIAGAGKRFSCTPDCLPHSEEIPCTKTWRRSPMWLVLRVALQINLLNPPDSGASSRSTPHWEYKILILYILTALLGAVIQSDDPKWSSEHLSHMSRKLACRAAKLEGTGLAIPTMLQDFVSKTVRRTTCVLNMRFAQVQAATVRQLNWPLVGEIDTHQDTELKMMNSRSYIKGVLEEYHNNSATLEEIPTSFPTNESPRIYHDASRSQMIFRCVEELEGSVRTNDVTNADARLVWNDIELWVETTLEDFAIANSNCEEACCSLSRLLASYTYISDIDRYISGYRSDPVGASIAVLTAIELWVAIDRIAISIIPLLKEYPCEVDPDDDLFTVLLLPKKAQMERLQKVRGYLQNRVSRATYPSIFNGYHKIDSSMGPAMPVDCNTFSVRYFDQSLPHQTLRDTIVKEACEQTAADQKNKRVKVDLPFASDTPKAKAIVFELDPPVVFATWRDATFRATLGFPRFEHDPEMCTVDIGEFKPDRDIFSHDNFIPDDKVLAGHYSPKFSLIILGAVYCRGRSLDNTWIYTRNAAGMMDIDWSAVGLNYVMLGLPLHFRLQKSQCDYNTIGRKQQHILLTTLIGSYQKRAEDYCTFNFADLLLLRCERNNYSKKRARVYKRTFDGPSPNSAVRINQEKPPEYVNCNWLPHQYYAFNTMLFGSRLRWLNMLREVKTHNPCLNSNNVDVLRAFLQGCWQTGPQTSTSNFGTHLRETHEILSDIGFCNQMLDALESNLRVIIPTWSQHLAMQVIISLGARILSLAQAPQIQTRAAYLLRLCRAVCIDWLVGISRYIKSPTIDYSSQRDWQIRGLLIVVTCRQTFDVDLCVSTTVFNSERDLGDFIECAVWPSIYSLRSWSFGTEDTLYTKVGGGLTMEELQDYMSHNGYLLARDTRMAHSIEPHLRHLVLTNNDWFHSAIERIVPGYIPGERWNVLAAPNDRWITTRSGGSTSMTLHYNLLKGTLFVDGEAVGQELPEDYTEDPLYDRIFAGVRCTSNSWENWYLITQLFKRTFRVSKADIPGMRFRTIHPVSASDSKLVLYFAMRDEDLIIRTKRGADMHEIICHTRLKHDFPKTLLDPYLHLLDLNRRKLEFQPWKGSGSIWDFADSDWVITISQSTKQTWSAYGQRTLPCGRELRMIDYHSPTQTALAEIFHAIEKKKYIELSFSIEENKVYLTLIRYKLEFAFDGTHTENTQIACQTFPGMVVDLQPQIGQDIRTLYGLETYLVLREAQIPLTHARRTVIIPEGEVLCSHKTSVNVRINVGASIVPNERTDIVVYHLYSVDHLLGRLVSNGDTRSLLYLSYLHALTSYCLRDPLTGLTGTQQALENLQDARVWSPPISELDHMSSYSPTFVILRLLNRLAPQRRHYVSKNAACAQLVYRSPNALFSYQYVGLYAITQSVLERWRDAAFEITLQEGTTIQTLSFNDQDDQALQEREAAREAAYLGKDHGGKQIVRTMQSLLPSLNVKPPTEPPNPSSHEESIAEIEFADPDPLRTLLDRFSSRANGVQRQYSADLERSWRALHSANEPSTDRKPLATLPTVQDMEDYMQLSLEYLQEIHRMIAEALAPHGDASAPEALLDLVGLQPRISAKSILLQLQEMNKDEFKVAPERKQVLVSFGISVTLYQRARRMYRAMRQGDIQLFTKEWGNKGHVAWDPQRFPEWILFEIENDLLIRPTQAKIAREMITPRAQGNFVMQLNMGEGKSSVIVPIVAAFLADGQRFVRVVVLKPLWNQMFDMLRQKLGGLLNRRIYHTHVSRQRVNTNPRKISIVLRIRDIFRECQKNGGIFLTQPEHLLSFKLIIAEMLCIEKDSRRLNQLLQTQYWLDEYARDIFDESDELLHPRYELIHTTGIEQPLELGAKRWGMVFKIFDGVKKYISKFKKEYPSAIDLTEREDAPGSFPFVRLLGKNVALELMKEVAVNIITENLVEWLPPEHICDQRTIDLTVNYVIDKNAKEDILSNFDEIPPPILLLKGLIGHEIIAFVLREKRWRVDYGHHDSNLAVPYRAKDSPVIGAQFAHPDITLALTCLCYYYQGLTEDQLWFCFGLLKDVRNPESEYSSWIQECKKCLPPPLWRLDGANLAIEDYDDHQWSHTLYPMLKLSKRAIDFYLSLGVFPSESRVFTSKLSTSAWDLAEKRAQPTTGFSGSNDHRYLLPLSIEQFEFDSHVHTNAKVLSYLLQPENRFYQCVQTVDGEPLSGRELILRMVDQQNWAMGQIQVIVDVGAQVLDMKNKRTAQYWLSEAAKRDSKWIAALYFNGNAELTVVDKEGRKQSYRSSPYVATENMTRCLVYLDEAYTRGTDIKLPGNSVAAVTLGPRMTKDKLVQACMRMRNLGHGQSVCFFAPPEVHQKILGWSLESCNECTQDLRVETIDILSWVMHETCVQTEQNLSLWARNGISYQARQSTSRWGIDSFNQEAYSSAWIEAAVESKTLTEMYSYSNEAESNSLLRIIERKSDDDQLRSQKQELGKIKARCENYQISSSQNTSLEQLQEREAARSQEHQREDPSTIPDVSSEAPCAHKLHPRLVQFIRTSTRPPLPNTPGSPFRTLAQTLEQTSLRNHIGEDPWTTQILTTVDFSRSLNFDSDTSMSELESEVESEVEAKLETDLLLHPVIWIMSTHALHNSNYPTLIIVSLFEANELLPAIRESSFVNLYMYSPRMQKAAVGIFDLVSGPTPPFPDKHRSHSIHPEMEELLIQINVYAGGLYFSSYEMYRKTCAFLGMCDMGKEQPTSSSIGWQRPLAECGAGKLDDTHPGDDAQVSGNEGGAVTAQPQRTRWEYLKHLVKLRARGVNIEHTHMGCLLRGEILQEKEWGEERVVDISPEEESSDAEDNNAYGDEDPMDMGDAEDINAYGGEDPVDMGDAEDISAYGGEDSMDMGDAEYINAYGGEDPVDMGDAEDINAYGGEDSMDMGDAEDINVYLGEEPMDMGDASEELDFGLVL